MKHAIALITLCAGLTACAKIDTAAPLPAPKVTARQVSASSQPRINSAHRLLFWTNVRDVAALTDAQLDLWKSRGVGGFICMTQHLRGMGGTQDFSGDAGAQLDGAEYETQRSLRDSQIVRRAKSRGLKMYLGCYVVDYYNTATPFKEWFDNGAWFGTVLPRVRDFAGAAKLLGFDGICFDQELYPQANRKTTATWAWNYPGNTHTEQEVRDQARQRGRQLMGAIVAVFPQVEIAVYHFQIPGTWESVVQKVINNVGHDVGAPLLFTDFWDGMTSIEGYRAIRFLDAIFYKMPHLGTWDTAFQYEFNGFFSTLSRRFSNWDYASSRVFLSPFGWINGNVAGEGSFTAPRPPHYVATQFVAFKRWGMGGEIANFSYGGLNDFDYAPYVKALRWVATPSTADAEPPRLEITAPVGAASQTTTARAIHIEGFARDNLAIRAVHWKNDRGGAGAARMTWQIESGDYTRGYKWRMDWSASNIALQPGANQIVVTAEDIKGLTASRTLTVQKSR